MGNCNSTGNVDNKTKATCAIVLRMFVLAKIRKEHPNILVSMEDLGGQAIDDDDRVRAIVNDLNEIKINSSDKEISTLTSNFDEQSMQDIINHVAGVLFKCDESWHPGRCVAFYHLAYLLIVKALTHHQLDLAKNIILWTSQRVDDDVLRQMIKNNRLRTVKRSLVPLVVGVAALAAFLFWFKKPHWTRGIRMHQ